MPALLTPPDTLALALLALALEAGVGYPDALYKLIGHPVTWIGRLIAVLDAGLNRPSLSGPARRALGGVALVLVLAATAGVALALTGLAAGLGRLPGLLGLALLGASLPAQRSLHAHVAAVADALRAGGLEAGRSAVSHIVGRDPESLDEAAICRAAIESLAENFSDGIAAPAFWLAFGGLPGAALYKAVNTADSMIGHRTPRHAAFGWAGARLDDLANWPASRLSAGLLILAATLRGADAGAAGRAVRRDASRHRSPNAGFPEAAMAGALGLRLAGPRRYGGTTVADAFMGEGRDAATPADIDRALALSRTACALLWGLIALAWLAAMTLT